MSKSLGELCKPTIIRISIIGEEVNNKRSLLEWVKSNSGKEINGYENHYWNGVTCLQLAKIVNEIYGLKITIDKTISSCFNNNFDIPELKKDQIEELKHYNL